MANVHVVSIGRRWAVTLEGRQRPISVHVSQTLAIEIGRTLALRQRVELVVHALCLYEPATFGKRRPS